MPSPLDCPHAALIDNRLYGYGLTAELAKAAFNAQVAGAPASMQSSMRSRIKLVPLTDDEASEVAEMIASPALSWA